MFAQHVQISVGHAHPRVTEAAYRQMCKHGQISNYFVHETPILLAEKLATKMPAQEQWQCMFTTSGSEAVDFALQVATTYTGKKEIVSLNKSYHGLTGMAAALTTNAKSKTHSHNVLY